MTFLRANIASLCLKIKTKLDIQNKSLYIICKFLEIITENIMFLKILKVDIFNINIIIVYE